MYLLFYDLPFVEELFYFLDRVFLEGTIENGKLLFVTDEISVRYARGIP